jgi:hypothetical protein
MSVQLIVFPQYFEGSGPLSSLSTELVVDGINFNAVNTSSSTQSIAGSLPQAFVDSNTVFGFSLFILNTWYRFSGVASEVDESSGAINFSPDEGIIQRLSSLTFGATYDLTLNITTNSTNLKVYQYKGDILKSTHTITGTGLQTISFNAYSTADIIAIYSVDTTAIIEGISCGVSTSTPSGVFTDLSNGQVICDLYEDEDIPLSLSIDDFKNIAEQVQSYSKAFNLPATKRNNQIFDNIFEVTRTDTGLNFNPYKKTKCILKQDGFLLFEGYLRLIDIQDKKGEISYNVNLYSEVIALADVLGERTFSDLDFAELEHDYNYTEIRNSWQGQLTVAPLPITSYANNTGVAGATTTNVLKYPFVDWTHQFTSNSNGPVLPRLESAFRPFIKIKYLIDRIFAATPFTYESAFFDTVDFGKLFMDFNWGDNENGSQLDASEYFEREHSQLSDYYINETSYNSASKLKFDTGTSSTNWNNSNYTYTSPVNNLELNLNYYLRLFNTATVSTYSNSLRLAKFDQYGNVLEVLAQDNNSIAAESTKILSGTVSTVMQEGEYIQAQSKVITANKIRMSMNVGTPSYMKFSASNEAMQTSVLLNQLRGELGQWGFLKGLLTMFNLVSIPDKDNPSNILIEPYSDVFIHNTSSGTTSDLSLASRSIAHDWTDKIDVSEMKLTPLTDLNKSTIFKFVEDEDDYAFNVYKTSVGSHLYGSKKYDASGFTILAGEDEVVAEPFAATVVKPLMDIYTDLIVSTVYSYNADDGTSAAFENSPRIMYDNGVQSALAGTFVSCTYKVPTQNGVSGDATEDEFLQFSHLTDIPTVAGSRDFHFGECQLMTGVGSPVANNLFNLYWLPYYNELYNPDTRIMDLKVNLNPSDISTFKMYDTVLVKNREFRVNKIDYKPNDLATVEFILVP